MIKRTVSLAHSASERRARTGMAWQRPLAISLLTLGLAPLACMSDVDLPPCIEQGTCKVAGASGSGAIAGAGVSGGADLGGEGGVAGEPAGAGGAGGEATGAGGPGGTGGAGGGSISPLALPAPCGTIGYSTGLRIHGGTPPFTWQVTPAVESWQVEHSPSAPDGSQVMLSSTHPGAPTVSIAATDATGKVVRASYSVTPRTACWFAFTASTDADGPKLHVVDPILESTPPETFAHNHGVYDFAFSPNGKYLSYRFGADIDHEKGRTLAVINLSTWAEHQLVLTDDTDSANDVVTAFAWSSDSTTLAAAFIHDEKQYLGGTRFTADGQPSKLTARQTAVDSELYWIGSSYVAFYANGLFDAGHPNQLEPYDGFATAFYSVLGTVGFEQPTLSTDIFYQLPIFEQTTSDGFYLNSPSWPYLQFNWIHPSGPTGVDHTGANLANNTSRIISPSGRFTADPPKGALQLYRAQSSEPILNSANAPDRDCPKLLTWAKGRERMACARDVPIDDQGKMHSELRIFDLGDDNALTVALVQGYCQKDPQAVSTADPCAALEYDYAIADANLQPRIFSKSGDWLAFIPSAAGQSTSYLYLADLRTKPFSLSYKNAAITFDLAATSASRLAFSPDEKYLLRQLGSRLTAYAVMGTAMSLPNFDAEAPDSNPTCSEDFASAPDRWCGSADRDAPFKWSPTSKLVAYRSRSSTNTETLTITDLAQFPNLAPHPFPAAHCGTKCSGQFAFQP
jgi:hypothetical protein